MTPPKVERHDECVRPEDWREVHDFISGTREYRLHLDTKIDGLVIALAENYTKNEKRIRHLENFRWMIAGAFCILTAVVIPIALAVIK